MELIAEIEGERRGVYAGAVGRWNFAGDAMDTCIAIRYINGQRPESELTFKIEQ